MYNSDEGAIEQSLTGMIWSELINNTSTHKGIIYTKLRSKVYKQITKDPATLFIVCGCMSPYDIKKKIDEQTFILLTLGHLAANNGYIFNNSKIDYGEHIPSNILRELKLYKSIYKDDILKE